MKRWEGEESQNMDLEISKSQQNPTAEELTEYDLVEMSGSGTELDDEGEDLEAAVPGKQLTLHSLAEAFEFSRLL